MKNIVIASVIVAIGTVLALADTPQYMTWQVGGISLQLPASGNAIEPFGGWDFRFKEAVTGAKTHFVNIYSEVYGDGGIAGVPSDPSPVQPYMGLSVDLKKHIPVLSSITDLDVNVSTRYNTGVGGTFQQHLGAILALGYQFP